MTEQQRSSVREMRIHGLSYGQIARFAALPVNSVKSFCRRENLVPQPTSPEEETPMRCRQCGKPLLPTKKHTQYFCSDACRYTWWNRNRNWARREKAHRLTCVRCGTQFTSYGNKKRKYCGRECYLRSRYGEGLP